MVSDLSSLLADEERLSKRHDGISQCPQGRHVVPGGRDALPGTVGGASGIFLRLR